MKKKLDWLRMGAILGFSMLPLACLYAVVYHVAMHPGVRVHIESGPQGRRLVAVRTAEYRYAPALSERVFYPIHQIDRAFVRTVMWETISREWPYETVPGWMNAPPPEELGD